MTQEMSIPYCLPSGGLLYGGKLPDGQVTIYPIRGEQEELLAGAGKANGMVVMQHVSQQLVEFPQNFAFQDLLVTDWFALLLNIFAFSYSPNINLSPTCPQCGESTVQTLDFSKLPCSYGKDIEKYSEPFSTDPLPGSGEVVQFHLHRLRHQQLIEEYQSQTKNKRGLSDTSVTYSMALQIHGIGGNFNLSELEKMRWIRKALGKDLKALRRSIANVGTGYDLTPEFSCPGCHADFRIELPIDFFRSLGSQS